MSPDEQLVKLCDPPTEETVEIPIEPTNSAGGTDDVFFLEDLGLVCLSFNVFGSSVLLYM